MKIKHIYWFAYYNSDSPSVRYRCMMPLAWMKENKNISFDIVYPGYRWKEIRNFITVYFEILFAGKIESIIVIQKVHTNKIYGRLLKLLVRLKIRNVIYDIDDADYLKYDPHVIHFFMRNCTSCFCGSNAIMQYNGRYNINNVLLTSPVPYSNKIKGNKNALFTVGWIGFYNAHRESFVQFIFEALKQIHFPVQLIILGVVKEVHSKEIKDAFRAQSNIQIKIPIDINWNDDSRIQSMIAEFDAGLAPLTDTPVNASKSAFKMKQYLSCGVPVLASPVGENAFFLQDKVNGFYCSTIEEFVLNLKLLNDMKNEDYRKLSINALQSSKSFTMESYCNNFLQYCESLN